MRREPVARQRRSDEAHAGLDGRGVGEAAAAAVPAQCSASWSWPDASWALARATASSGVATSSASLNSASQCLDLRLAAVAHRVRRSAPHELGRAVDLAVPRPHAGSPGPVSLAGVPLAGATVELGRPPGSRRWSSARSISATSR